MTNEKFEKVLAHLNNAFNELSEAKEIASKDDKISSLDNLIDRTGEAIYRWKFRNNQAKE